MGHEQSRGAWVELGQRSAARMPAASRRLRRIAGHLRSTRSANAAALGASRKPARTWQEQSGLKRPAVEAEALTEEAHVQQYGCTPGQMYQFDVNGFFVMKAHYSAEQVATLNAGVDELQRIPVEHAEYMRLGVAHPLLTAAQADPEHEVWSKGRQEQEDGRPPLRVDMGICGTDKWDLIVRDEQLRKLHRTLAGGATMLSATYFIEKLGPGAAGGPLHFGGYPRQRNFHYEL